MKEVLQQMKRHNYLNSNFLTGTLLKRAFMNTLYERLLVEKE